MGEAGCVSWIFEQKGYIVIDHGKCDEDTLIGVALDAGAEDVRVEDDSFEVFTMPAKFEVVRQAIADKGITYVQAEVSRIPKTLVKLDENGAQQTLKLVEALEEHDDVQKVYANFDIDESILEKLE
jgi:transcriptional/translational regulatory protein YebC/TACO1